MSFNFLPAEPEHELPAYEQPGRILVDVHPKTGMSYNWDYEVLDYDGDSGVFWINEGVGFDWWLDDVDFPGPGRYLIENVRGRYIRGTWGFDDDDEEWDWDEPKRALWSTLAPRTLREALNAFWMELGRATGLNRLLRALMQFLEKRP